MTILWSSLICSTITTPCSKAQGSDNDQDWDRDGQKDGRHLLQKSANMKESVSSLFGKLYGTGLNESKLKASIPVLMQVGMPWRLTLSLPWLLTYSSVYIKNKDIPSTLIQDEASNKIWACKYVEENDASSGKEAESSQYGHALHKIRNWFLMKKLWNRTVDAPMKNAAASVKEVTVMATPACFIACENKSLHVHNICFDLDSLEPLSLLGPGCR